MAQITQLSREDVLAVLNWTDTIAAVEAALLSVTEKRAIETRKEITTIPGTTNQLISRTGCLNDETYNATCCKLVTIFPDNLKHHLPFTENIILLFNEINGTLEALIDGIEITFWKSAATSIVATKYMRSSDKKNNILAILGAGAAARIHAVALQEIFKFEEVRLWTRDYEKAKELCHQLNSWRGEQGRYVPFKEIKDCIEEADVIITATRSTDPLLKYEWLKRGVHINAVGNVEELDEKTYKSSATYVDHLAAIESSLEPLTHMGVIFRGELGALINGNLTVPSSHETTIFRSTGLVVEDGAIARLVYNNYKKKKVRDSPSN